MIARPHLLLLAALIAAGILYSLGVQGPFVLDDMSNLAPLEKLHESGSPWHAVVFGNNSGALGRSISMMTFLANYWLHGLSATWFKVTNVTIHLACGFSVYLFLAKLLNETAYRLEAKRLAAIAASFWLISPLFASTVLYVIQRMAMLSALFTLLALHGYLCFRQSLSRVKPNYSHLVQFCVLSGLALFSKENAALIPLFILVLEVFFCKKLDPQHPAFRQRAYLVFVVGVMPLLIAVALIIHNPQIVLDYSKRSFTLDQRVLTELRILWDYLRSLTIPQSSQFGLFHDDIIISTGIFNPLSTAVSIAAWLAVVVAIFAARYSDKARAIGGGVAFFLVGHMLESTVLPLELYFEHRNYLPGVGAYLSLVVFGRLVIERGWISTRVIQFAASAYGIVLCIVLSQRVLMWSSYELLIYSSYEAHPLSPRANIEAALLDARTGQFDAAEQKIVRVKELLPQKVMGANAQRLYIYCLLNRPGLTPSDVEAMANAPVDDSSYTATGLGELNNLYRERGCANVPYAEYMAAMSDRLSRFYSSGEYKAYNERRLMGVASVNLRIMEGLNSLAKTGKTIELAAHINNAQQGGFAVDLLTAVALIDQGRMQEAAQLIEKQKRDESLLAQLQAKSLANIEQIYNEKLKGAQ